jgi:hypothetical protein
MPSNTVRFSTLFPLSARNKQRTSEIKSLAVIYFEIYGASCHASTYFLLPAAVQCALDLLKAGNGGGADTPGMMNDFHDGGVRCPSAHSHASLHYCFVL